MKRDAIPHAISMWITVHDLIDKGCFEATDDDNTLAKAAAKSSEQAMQLLGFSKAAATVSSLLKELQSKSSAKKGKRKTGTTDAATAELPATAVASVSTAVEQSSQASSTASTPHNTINSSKPSQPTAIAVQSRSSAFSVGCSEAVFQLCYCGDVLPRAAPAEPDPRVISFNPDMWQRKVLDAIDAGASSVICAPTSSGKTFISSYCMDRVLSNVKDKDGVVVFVAPTKALVNQTAAQVSVCSK